MAEPLHDSPDFHHQAELSPWLQHLAPPDPINGRTATQDLLSPGRPSTADPDPGRRTPAAQQAAHSSSPCWPRTPARAQHHSSRPPFSPWRSSRSRTGSPSTASSMAGPSPPFLAHTRSPESSPWLPLTASFIWLRAAPNQQQQIWTAPCPDLCNTSD